MPDVADLIETARQERINAEEYLTRAETDPVRAEELRTCAALCFHQAEEAELAIKAISEIYGESRE